MMSHDMRLGEMGLQLAALVLQDCNLAPDIKAQAKIPNIEPMIDKADTTFGIPL